MEQKQFTSQKPVVYFFLRSKDVHEENKREAITLFTRLTRETIFYTAGKWQKRVETFWVQINDLAWEQASEKVKNMPNCIQKYEVTEKVFQHLLQLCKTCPEGLFGITPYYIKVERVAFLPWQELEKCWQNSCVKSGGYRNSSSLKG